MREQQWQQARLSRDRRFDGRFFVAVKTTGIFCRNVCPANLPKEQNVEYYTHAAQALNQGYRPCLRCRPDSAPQSYAWLGVETTVVRAMCLLRENYQAGLETIAERLGISDGYLRKLFRQHLGVSPKQFQLTEQLLFAKKLLHETQLSVEQVAISAGFQSARRLQQNMQQTMNLTPSQIRNQRTIKEHPMQLSLSFSPEYCWQQIRDFWQIRAVAGVEKVTESSYERTFQWDGDSGHFKVEIEPEKYRFQVQISMQNYANLHAVLNNIKRILDLETDYAVVRAGLLQTGLGEAQLTPGIRIPGVWSVFEAGCRAVLGQQVSVKAAVNKVAQLTEHLGQTIAVDSECSRLFPTPKAVAQSDLDFLRMPQARKNALRELARFIDEQGEDASPERWLDIKGIGPWTVAYARMRGLSEPDIWLGTDLVIKNQIKQYSLDTDAAAPWRSYLTFQLWDNA